MAGFDPNDYIKNFPTASDFISGFQKNMAGASAIMKADKDQKAADAALARKNGLQGELTAALQAGDHERAMRAAVQLASPDKGAELLQGQPKANIENEAAVAKEVVPVARQYLKLSTPEDRVAYLTQAEGYLVSHKVPQGLIDGLKADPMNPALNARIQSLVEAGYDEHNMVNDGTQRITADTNAFNAKHHANAEGAGHWDENGNYVQDYRAPKGSEYMVDPGYYAGQGGGMPSAAAPAAPAAPVDPLAPLPEGQAEDAYYGGPNGAAPQPQRGAPGDGRSYRDPVHDRYAANAEARHGLPEGILGAIRTKGERSNNGQVSEAGARGVYQFIPATRAAFLKKYGVDAWGSPAQAAEAAALHLKESYARTGSWDKAVREYIGGTDPEAWGPTTRAYTKRVGSFDGRVPTQNGDARVMPPQGSAPAPSAPVSAYGVPTTGGQGVQFYRKQEKPTEQWSNVTLPSGAVIAREASGRKPDRVVTPAPKAGSAGPKAKPTDILAAQTKFRTADRLLGQINDIEKLGDQVWIKGPLAGAVPDWLRKVADPKSDQFDKAVAPIMKAVAGLARSPGEGPQSDYDARLTEATMPERLATPEGRAQSIRDIRKLVTDIKRDQAQFLRQFGGQGGSSAPRTGGNGGGIRQVSSIEEARALPKGTKFRDPNGVERTR